MKSTYYEIGRLKDGRLGDVTFGEIETLKKEGVQLGLRFIDGMLHLVALSSESLERFLRFLFLTGRMT